MMVSISGSPGVGKTATARVLESRFRVIYLRDLIEKEGFIIGYDDERDCCIIDLKALNNYLGSIESDSTTFIEGIVSHLLNTEFVVVLRCNPKELERRLRLKGYKERKIRDNVESEIIDLITLEAMELHDKVYEIDTTNLSPEDAAKEVIEILNGDFKGHEVGKVNWLEVYNGVR